MSKIKTPKEWIRELKYAPKKGAQFEQLAWTAKHYHEYSSKLEMEEKIKELEKEMNETNHHYNISGLARAIELLRSRI